MTDEQKAMMEALFGPAARQLRDQAYRLPKSATRGTLPTMTMKSNWPAPAEPTAFVRKCAGCGKFIDTNDGSGEAKCVGCERHPVEAPRPKSQAYVPAAGELSVDVKVTNE